MVLHHWNSENWKQFFFAKNVPKYKMYLNDYISKSIQDTVGRYVRWGIGMGVIFLITNRVNKQIIPQTKVWIKCHNKIFHASITIGMGVIFLITNRVNKQIIPQTKVWIINVIIKYLAHLMYLRWYYTIEIVKIENNFFSLKMSLNIRCT